jgi:hypothetical protein
MTTAERTAEIAKMLASATERLEALKKARAALVGNCYVIYTGEVDCPVFVKLSPTRDACLPNIGIGGATRLSYSEATHRARNIYNGNNQVAHAISEARAYDAEIVNVTKLIEWLNAAPARAKKVKKILAA